MLLLKGSLSPLLELINNREVVSILRVRLVVLDKRLSLEALGLVLNGRMGTCLVYLPHANHEKRHDNQTANLEELEAIY